jgi:hypothetical protein
MTAQPGERTVSWLDEDDPNRGAKPFAPVESVIELTPPAGEPPPRKKSRREKAPKPPKPPREKRWRREKATQEKPASENPPRDVTPRAEDWPAPASEDWLTTLRGPAPRQEWAAARDTQPRDAATPPEWTTVPDEAPREDEAARSTGPHPAWAAAPEGALDDDGWTTTPPLQAPREPELETAPAPAQMSREDWFTPRDEPSRDGWAATPEAAWDPPRDPDARPDWNTAQDPDARPDWNTAQEPNARPDWNTAQEPNARPDWNTAQEPEDGSGWNTDPEPERRSAWNTDPEPAARPDWVASPEPAARPDWVTSPEPAARTDWDTAPPPDRRSGWDTGPEQKARPDWVTTPVPAAAPAAAPDDAWSAPDLRDGPTPEAWPAPLDITPDDDLAEPPAKQRRVPGSGRPTGGRPPGRPGRRRKPLMLLAIALTAAIVGAAVVAAGTVYRLVFDGGTPGSHTIAAPLDGRTQAQLELASGAATVTVRGADLGDDLFQVTTPDGDDAVPLATIQGDRTTVRLASNSGEEASAVEVRLNSRVTWRLLFSGGARTQTVDLAGGRLAGLEMTGGATRLELTLPKPAATVPIRLRGGLDELLMHAPAGVLTRVKVTKGATNVTLDRLNRSKVAPDTTFTPNGWGDAKARYDVNAAEGIGTVKLDRR